MFFDDPVRPSRTCGAPQATGAELRSRVAERCGESVHDDGRARRRAAPAGPPRPSAGRAWPVRFRGPRPRAPDPRRERLGRDRYPADRCCRAHCPRTRWFVTSPGSVPSAASSQHADDELARGSSPRSAPPSILTSTVRRSASPPRAGWSAPAPNGGASTMSSWPTWLSARAPSTPWRASPTCWARRPWRPSFPWSP